MKVRLLAVVSVLVGSLLLVLVLVKELALVLESVEVEE